MLDFKNLIYQLKQTYGTVVDLYRESDKVTDPLTGKTTITRTKYTISKCVVLPSVAMGKLPFLREANLIFKNSGGVDVDERQLIIDVDDIAVTPELSDYMIFNHTRFDMDTINDINDFRRTYGYHIIIKTASTSTTYEIHEFNILDHLTIAQKIGLIP